MSCPAGKYPSNGKCQWCWDGQYSNAGDTICTWCHDGKPLANPGHTACIDNDGCTSAGGSVISNQCRCPKGAVPNANGGKCEACPEGFAVSVDNMQCVTRQECRASVASADVFEEGGKKQCRCQLGYCVYGTDSKYCSQCFNGSQCPDGINSAMCTKPLISNPGYTGCITSSECKNGRVFIEHCACLAGYIPSSDGKTCVACPNDQVADFDNSKCITKKECELRNGVLDGAQTQCICQAGRYLSGSKCHQCQSGAINTTGSHLSDCSRCSTGSTDVSNLKHTACVAEFECTKIQGAKVVDYEAGGKQCVCPVDQVPNKDGTVCEPCPEGTMAYPGMLECITDGECQSIQSAQVAVKDGQKQCQCPAGAYFDLEHNTCFWCSDGWISVAGAYGDYGNVVCQKCNGDTPYSSPDKTKCVTRNECSTMGATASSSSACYCSTSEALDNKKQKCEKCTGQNETGGGNGSVCVCKDRYGVSSATGLCEMCPAGTYSNRYYSVTKEQCRPCPEGTASVAGQYSCTTCSGLLPIALAGNIGCVAIAEQCGEHAILGGRYNNQCYCITGYGHKNGTCEQCGPGEVSPEGSNECTACGEYGNPNNEKTKCVCAAGYFPRDGTCKKCAHGRISSKGADVCTPCDAAGNQLSNDARDACICKGGYGADVAGKACQKCEGNTIHAENPAENTLVACAPCENGKIPNADLTICIEPQSQQNRVGLAVGLSVAFVVLAVTIAVVVVMVLKRRRAAAAAKKDSGQGSVIQ